jgi:hypothetical protein
MSSFLEKRASREGREGREGQGQLPCKRSLEEKTISEKCLLEKENEIQNLSTADDQPQETGEGLRPSPNTKKEQD